jgi:dihydroorotate dehydrogenase (fumarate)
MDLSTEYLGFKLPHPLVPGSSPLGDDLDTVKRLEDAGAPAIVLRSLFEEQITQEQMAEHVFQDGRAESSAEATTYFPSPELFVLNTDSYLEHLRKVKAAVSIPVIASLNGTTPGGWLAYARQMQQAGADALELNVYRVPTDLGLSGAQIEQQTVEVVRQIKAAITIPIAVKLSPFLTAPANVARQLEEAGASGLVLFNRFYQPDINIDELAVSRTLDLSDSSELLLRTNWMAILSARVKASLAVTGGVHTALDVIKATMAGAHVTQMVSALLLHGPEYLGEVLVDLQEWMTEHKWDSLSEMRGNMGLGKVSNPELYERANYMVMLQSWRRTARG